MTDWGAFAGVAGVVVLAFLALARASTAALDSGAIGTSQAVPVVDETDPLEPGEGGTDPVEPDASAQEAAGTTGAADLPKDAQGPGTPAERTLAQPPSFGTGQLLANVLATHGLLAVLVAGAAVYWRVPAAALGVSPPTAAAVGVGLAVGVALYVADEVGAALAARLGVDHDERVRELLAPSSGAGWVVLLGAVLPLVAVAEELVFRGVLIGALAAGFGLPAWGLVVGSAAAFALGHGAQGRGGVVVTGLLGGALGAMFVVTGSLLVVAVAHYVVNVLEFVVHEGLGVEWAG